MKQNLQPKTYTSGSDSANHPGHITAKMFAVSARVVSTSGGQKAEEQLELNHFMKVAPLYRGDSSGLI